MAFEAKFGSFNVITTGIGNTQAITGVGFQPKVVLFWSAGRTESADAAGSRDLISMFGVGVSSGDRRFSAVRSRNGQANSAGDEAHREDSCLGFTDGLGAFDGYMDLQSMDSDGFTLVVDNQLSVAYRVHYLALGGSDILEVQSGSFATRTSAGSQVNTSVGFQPDLLLLFGSRTDDATTDINVSDFANLMVGAATGPGDDHVGYTESQLNALSTMNTASYCRAGEILAVTGTNRSVATRAELTSMDTNGFTLEYLEAIGLAFRTHYLAIRGGSYVVGDLLTETNTSTDIVESGFGFAPSAALFVSSNKAESTQDVADAGAELSIGAFTSLTDRGAMVVLDQDAIADSETATAQEHDAVYANLSVSDAIEGLMDIKSIDSDGFTCIMDDADPSQFFVWYIAMGGIAELDKVHSSDVFIQDLAAQVHSADVVIQIEPTDQVHSADAFVDPLVDQVHSADGSIADLIARIHSTDIFIEDLPEKVHSADAHITGPVDAVHSADVVIVTPGEDSVKLEGTILFPIDSTQGYVRTAAELAEPTFGHVQLAAELVEQAGDFVGLRATLAELGSEFIKLAGTLFDGGEAVHSADVVISTEASEFVKLSTELIQPLAPGSQGVFPNKSYVKLAAWIVSPVPGEDSIQVPGTDAEDFLSSDVAQGAYTAISRFILDGIALIITQFTTGVISFQTRTRQWLRRIDAAPGGILVSTRTQLRVLPNGEKITIVTETKQIKDTEIVTVTTTHDTVPERVTIEITESNRFGMRTRREIQTITENGIRKTLEKRIVDTSPPTKDNIQPIRVRTLDGVEHFQWFGDVNPNFAGGDEEGTTITERAESIQPGQLNGQTIDTNGNPILMKVIDETVSRPDGSVQQTHTEIIGITTQAGTTITDEEETFDGVLTKRRTIVTHPDGSQTITEVEDNAQTGIVIEVETTNLTDENGRKTTTVVETTTETFFDEALGRNRTKTTRKTTVTDDQGSETVDTTTTDRDNFEDDIVNRKIKVFLVQEFTLNCLIDTFSMNALLERQIQHQRGFAELELLGQQLGNADLTWDLRHDLITKFEEAVERIRPLQMQALGRTYEIVFAPSASAFRARYIVGTEPHVYELQLILHERGDIVTGLRGF